MTTKAELESRRQRISEAAWRVLARDGLGDLSVRKVAAEVGLPPSSLRYLFPTQTSLREQAIALVLERLGARVAAVRLPEDDPQWPLAILLELLPLDPERRLEMEVFLALGTAAMAEPDLQEVHLRVHEAVHATCARAVGALCGRDGAALDVEINRLHALVDGLALHIVRQPPSSSTRWAVDALETHLAQIRATA